MINGMRELREKNKMSQEKFAHAVGISRQTVSSIENGGIPKYETMEKVAKRFGVSIDSIFFNNHVKHNLQKKGG